MEDDNTEEGLFDEAIRKRQDITGDYFNRAVLLSRLLGDAPLVAEEFSGIIRKLLENSEYGTIGRLEDVPRSVLAEVDGWHRDGRIGAVDGTDAIAITTLPHKIPYAVGVVTLTSKQRGEPIVRYTETGVDQHRPKGIQDIYDLQQKIEAASEERSWARSFREYEEGLAAIKLVEDDGCRLALRDGPLYTQNLLTQPSARKNVLEPIRAKQNNYIGYIKQMDPFATILGSALEQGEYWVYRIYKDMLEKRFLAKDRKSGKPHPAGAWVQESGHWVRCIYRVNGKAFEFECDESMVPHGLALLSIDQNLTLNHEIPFLLELVDKHVRAVSDAMRISQDLIMGLGKHAAAFQHEREFRS